MKHLRTVTLAEIVKQNAKAIDILEDFSLDYFCHGFQRLEDVCQETNVDASRVIKLITEIAQNSSQNDFDTCKLIPLIDYICSKHHNYVKTQTPLLDKQLLIAEEQLAHKYPRICEIRKQFSEIAGELMLHVKKEEFLLFPFIKRLERAKDSRQIVASPLFGWGCSPVRMMKNDHAIECDKFRRIKYLTNDYTSPNKNLILLISIFQQLKEYEKDLHFHIHLENNILFPKALDLEKQVDVAGPF